MRWLAAIVACTLTGCATWRPVDPQGGADLGEGVFLVSGERAVLVEVSAIDPGVIHGVMRGGCVADGLPLLPHELDSSDSPDRTCERLGWARAGSTGAETSVPLSGVVDARVYDPKVMETVLLGAGGLALLTGIAFLVLIGAGAGSTTIEGRPLRAGDAEAVAPTCARSDWTLPVALQPVDPARAQRLAAAWTSAAQKEHASVAAFSRLSLQLVALGSPPELVRRALRSSLQEIEHARLCFALASGYGGTAVGPGPLPEAVAAAPVTLEGLARESLIDGCLGEGLSAAIARASAARADDPAIAAALTRLARDEAEHADLGWAVVEWCLERGGAALRAHLLGVLEAARAPRAEDLPQHEGVSIEAAFRAVHAEAHARLRVSAEPGRVPRPAKPSVPVHPRHDDVARR